MKTGNEYSGALGKFFEDTPKAVFAALAYSFAACRDDGDGETDDPAVVVTRLKHEWRILRENGIVPQKEPRDA